jgi:hypothetical protein
MKRKSQELHGLVKIQRLSRSLSPFIIFLESHPGVGKTSIFLPSSYVGVVDSASGVDFLHHLEEWRKVMSCLQDDKGRLQILPGL